MRRAPGGLIAAAFFGCGIAASFAPSGLAAEAKTEAAGKPERRKAKAATPSVSTASKAEAARGPKGKDALVARPEPAAAPKPASDGTFKFGGAIRARYDFRANDATPAGNDKASNHFSFDTLALKASYDSSSVFGAAQYRFYGGSFIYGKRNGYERYPGEVNFPMWAYAGYKLTPDDSLTAGISQAPFGLTPYFGSSFLESLGFTAGLEEVYNLGAKYTHTGSNWSADLAFYPTAAPDAVGVSRDSARYSANMVKADSYVPDASDNHEKNMAVGRLEYTLLKTDVASFSAGVSGWLSEVHNLDTGRDGRKTLAAAHVAGTYGNWGFKAIYVRQDIDAKNAGRDDMVTIGGFDASYNIAAHGNFVSGEINYKIPEPVGPFSVSPYLNYSAFFKDKAGFKASERYILGAAWTYKADPRLVIYSEGVLGRNDPYVGAGQFTSGLAQGGDDSWKAEAIVNIGFYF